MRRRQHLNGVWRPSRVLSRAVALLLCAAAMPSMPGAAAVLDPRAVRSETLHNGLRLVVCEDPAATVVAVNVIVKVGSADDPPDRPGTAHLLEHVLWGSGGENDPRARVERIGGVMNAGTLRDFTRFYASVPRGELELAVRALGDVVLREEFGEAIVAREQGVVLREGAARGEDPRSLLNDLAFEAVYGDSHPYGRPIHGDPDQLHGIAPARLAAFHSAWYVPNNMAVTVVGDTTFEEASALAASIFGALRPGAVPERRWPAPPRPPGGGERVVESHLEKAYVMAAYVGPAISEPDEVCASDLLATLLAHGPVARLNRELKERRRLVAAVGVDFLTQRERALLGIWAVCEPEDVAAVKDAIRGEMHRLAEEPVPGPEFAAAKRLLCAGYAFANETPADRATTLGFYEAIDRYRAASYYLPRVGALDRSDILRVMRWYAGDPMWIVLRPEGEAG
jgi:zinc protease